MNNDKVIKTRALGLSRHATVFQAELQAIRLACSLMKDCIPKNTKVNFLVDSQAAILALENHETKSILVKQTKEALNSSEHEITITWIMAHNGLKGNEIADRLAKTGGDIAPTCHIGQSPAYVKQTVRDNLYRTWDRQWQTEETCRQTFDFYKCVDRTLSKTIYKLNRHDLGILIRYTTGHAHLRRHNKIANTCLPTPIPYPENKHSLKDPEEFRYSHLPDDFEVRCRKCQIKGSAETPTHLFKECLAVWRERREFLGQYSFEDQEHTVWNPKDLLGFFKILDLENKPNF